MECLRFNMVPIWKHNLIFDIWYLSDITCVIMFDFYMNAPYFILFYSLIFWKCLFLITLVCSLFSMSLLSCNKIYKMSAHLIWECCSLGHNEHNDVTYGNSQQPASLQHRLHVAGRLESKGGSREKRVRQEVEMRKQKLWKRTKY